MTEPLMLRLRRPDFLSLAELQDRFVDTIFSFDHDFVLHGGTAIWRCYNGNRFSFDIDGYITSKKESVLLKRDLTWEISRGGMRLTNMRTMDGTIIAGVASDTSELKLELLHTKRRIRPVIANYERVDGSALSIRTLSAADFAIEKAEAYVHRHYIRDLYDVYQLVDRAKQDPGVRSRLRRFVNRIEPAAESPSLNEIVFSGIVPSFDDMVSHIKGALNEIHG